MKRVALFLLVGLIAVGGGWWWSYSKGPCGKRRVREGAARLASARARWVDAVALAGKSTASTMGPHVAKLQEIRQEVEADQLPPCLARPQQLLVDHMTGTIEFLTKFMAGTDQKDGDMVRIATSAKWALTQYEGDLETASACQVATWNPQCQ